jgi:hypothetical protein
MATIGQAKRQDAKLLMGCIKGEIKAGRRDKTIAKMIGDQVSVKDMVGLVRWIMTRSRPQARRY